MEGLNLGHVGLGSHHESQPRLIDYPPPPSLPQNFTSGLSPFDPGFMEGFYNSAVSFLNAIFPTFDSEKLGYTLDSDNMLDFSNFDFDQVVWDHRGPIVFVIIMGILGLLLTVVGIGWCVKRCCCRDRGCFCERPYDPSKNRKTKASKKFIITGVTLGLGMIFLSFLIYFFAANEHIRKNSNQFPAKASGAVADARLYIDGSNIQINFLFKNNFEILATALQTSLLEDETAVKRTGLSPELTRAVLNLNEMAIPVMKLAEGVQKNKTIFDTSDLDLHHLNLQGQDFLTVTKLTKILSTKLADSLVKLIEDWKNELAGINLKMAQPRPQAVPIEAIENMRQYLGNTAKDLTNALETVPLETVQDDLDDVDDFIDIFSRIWRDCMIVLGVFFLAILLFLTFGMALQAWGKEPNDPYMKSHPHYPMKKSLGSILINLGLFFIFFWIFWVTMLQLALFSGAGAAGQIVCEALHNISTDTTDGGKFEIKAFPHADYKVPPYSKILKDCKNNLSAYEAFHLVDAYDVTKILNLYDKFLTPKSHLNAATKTPNSHFRGLAPLTASVESEIRELEDVMRRLKVKDGETSLELEYFKQFSKDWTELTVKVENLNRAAQLVDDILKRIHERILEEEVKPEVDNYAKWTVGRIETQVGNCEPVYNAFTTTVDSVCVNIVKPVAGLWLAVFILFFLFIPYIIAGWALAVQYSPKYKKGGYRKCCICF